MTTPIAPPAFDPDAIDRWVDRHLGDLPGDAAPRSRRFVGGQRSADAALATFDVSGYARRRNEVLPPGAQGASRLSPYIRHGLLPLRRVWDAVASGPPRDRAKYRDELLWQEYARHVYARVGRSNGAALRFRVEQPRATARPADMACLDLLDEQLTSDGWLVNQSRMWYAAQWAVREGADWTDGEERFFRHLLDGSRAANRLGWQWTAGTATGRPYAFSRHQVERRAPGLCDGCAHEAACPIGAPPPDPRVVAHEPDARLGADNDVATTTGPIDPVQRDTPDRVWLTAESLGDDDPALAAHPDLPVVFVFDRPLLERLALSRKRLVFLAECLADLGERRPVSAFVGDPAQILSGTRVAVTHAPVPGFRALTATIRPVEVHPWPWLVRPHERSIRSFSAWRRHIRPPS